MQELSHLITTGSEQILYAPIVLGIIFTLIFRPTGEEAHYVIVCMVIASFGILLGSSILFLSTENGDLKNLYRYVHFPFWLFITYASLSVLSYASLRLCHRLQKEYDQRMREWVKWYDANRPAPVPYVIPWYQQNVDWAEDYRKAASVSQKNRARSHA